MAMKVNVHKRVKKKGHKFHLSIGIRSFRIIQLPSLQIMIKQKDMGHNKVISINRHLITYNDHKIDPSLAFLYRIIDKKG